LNRLYFTFLLIFASIACLGCSTGKAVALQASETAPDSSGEVRPQPEKQEQDRIARWAYRRFVDGLLYEGEGELEVAAQHYKTAFEAYPDSYEIGYSYAAVLYRLQKPIEALQAIESFSQKEADLYRLRAACYRSLGDPGKTKNAYMRLLEIEPSDQGAYSFLVSYFQRRNDVDSTIWAYEKIAEFQTENYRLQNELGKLYGLKGDFNNAKRAYRHSLEIMSNPQNVQAAANLAELYELTQQVDSAEIWYEAALEFSPSTVLLHRELARLAFMRDSISKALVHVRAIAELSPRDKEAQRNLAILYFTEDSLQQADSVLSLLVASGESHPTNHYYLGRIAAISEDYDRAISEFTQLTELVDSVYDSWADLAFVYRQMGDTARELSTYRTGLEHMRDPENRTALLYALGAALEHAGQMDSLIVVLELVLKDNPDHHQAMNFLGYVLADRGLRLEYARDLILRAMEQQPNNPAYLDSYGWVQYRLGNFEDAVNYLQTAAGLDNDPVIFDHLGDACHSAGQTDEARVWWQKALEQQPDNDAIKEKLGR